MNFRATRAEKIVHSSRYKAGGTKYSSLEEARAIRAAQKKRSQKAQREKSLAHFRTLSTTADQENEPRKKYTKKELEELGRRRYKEMLQWKEQRRQKLEKEKRLKQPNFSSGLYHPDPPKFLSGTDVDPSTGKVTPWKFTTPWMSSRKGTPSSSQRPGGRIPGVAKPLRFHSGATPNMQTGALASRGIIKGGSSSLLRGTRVDSGIHCRVSRPFRPPPGLGVSPLPITPSVEQAKPISRVTKSFAPKNFAFQVPAGVASFSLGSKPPDEPFSEVDGRGRNVGSHVLAPEKGGGSATGFESTAAPAGASHRLNVSFTIEEDGGRSSPEGEMTSHDGGQKRRRGEETPPLKEGNGDSCVEREPPSKEGKGGEKRASKERGEETPSKEGKIEGTGQQAGGGLSPTPRRSYRWSTRSKSQALVTPPLARLRPRTPCSRSTRRSMLAHCDHAAHPPPTSGRKRRRTTKGRVETPSAAHQETPAALSHGRERSTSAPETPAEEAAWAARLEGLEASPWITRSRGSSSKRKKKGKEPRGEGDVFSNDLERYFNGVPTGGDAMEASPQLNRAEAPPPSGEAEMAHLLRPSETVTSLTPDPLVWGTPNEDSPDMPQSEQPQPGEGPSLSQQQRGDRPPLAEVSPATRTNNPQTPLKKGGKRPSVSFAPEENTHHSDRSDTPFRFPVTPIRRSSRNSMALFAKIPHSPPLEANAAPVPPVSPAATQHDKGRISLLPGLYSPVERDEESATPPPSAVQEDVDLISWDSPIPVATNVTRRTRRSKKPDALTPARRSTRLSRVGGGGSMPP